MLTQINMRILILLLTFFIVGCQSKNSFILPAEWEPHQAMMVSFDNEPFADSVSVGIVKAISPLMKVYCVIKGDTLTSFYSNWFHKEEILKDSIQFMDFGSSFSYSIRDPLFFLKNKKGEKAIADFAWNDYAYIPPDSSQRTTFYKQSAQDRNGYGNTFTRLFSYPLLSSKMVNEGGAIEVNGKGTLIQVESVNMQRNPGMGLPQQEQELKRMLGVTKIIWLKEGVADDPDGRTLITKNYFGIGVNGHVDEFCRFVNSNTIFLTVPDSLEAQKDPITKITYERMRENYKILKQSVDQDGKHFNIVKTPAPDFNPVKYILDSLSIDMEVKRFSKRVLKKYSQFHPGDTTYFIPARSYLNFLVTNKVVLIPQYWKIGLPESTRQKDEQVKALFETYFPGRKIVQINPMGLNYQGGGIHCWTQQIPK
ncbi:MAG: agmatine deiminase family protein [Aquaticitalea sp.]